MKVDNIRNSSHHGDHGGDWKWHSLCHPIGGHQNNQVGTFHRLQQLRLKITWSTKHWLFLQNLWIVGVEDDHGAEEEGSQDNDPCSPKDWDELADWKTWWHPFYYVVKGWFVGIWCHLLPPALGESPWTFHYWSAGQAKVVSSCFLGIEKESVKTVQHQLEIQHERRAKKQQYKKLENQQKTYLSQFNVKQR